MTEALRKWIEERASKRYPITVHYEEYEAALRAFCDELQKRATDKWHNTQWNEGEHATQKKAFCWAFDELKKELLG